MQAKCTFSAVARMSAMRIESWPMEASYIELIGCSRYVLLPPIMSVADQESFIQPLQSSSSSPVRSLHASLGYAYAGGLTPLRRRLADGLPSFSCALRRWFAILCHLPTGRWICHPLPLPSAHLPTAQLLSVRVCRCPILCSSCLVTSIFTYAYCFL